MKGDYLLRSIHHSQCAIDENETKRNKNNNHNVINEFIDNYCKKRALRGKKGTHHLQIERYCYERLAHQTYIRTDIHKEEDNDGGGGDQCSMHLFDQRKTHANCYDF